MAAIMELDGMQSMPLPSLLVIIPGQSATQGITSIELQKKKTIQAVLIVYFTTLNIS